MNIIDTSIKLNSSMKLVHCKKCDATWIDKKIPNVCPNCGAPKKGNLAGAKEDECESFMEAYNEAMASAAEDSSAADGIEEESTSVSSDYEEVESTDNPLTNQDTGYSEESYSEDAFEPIGYDPDELANAMADNPPKKPGRLVVRDLVSTADRMIKERKWAMQRAGLPTASLQFILPDVKNQAEKLGKYVPEYTELMLKMSVDNVLQQELRHPRKGRTYAIRDVNEMLEELEISEDYWESYYAVAGLM